MLFASDNGPHKEGGNNPELFDSNGPLRGIKRDLRRRYPHAVSCAMDGKNPSLDRSAMKFVPSGTFADLGGHWRRQELRGVDGISFVPAFSGGKLPERPYLYWEFHEAGFSQAVRFGSGKACGGRTGAPRLNYTT